MPPTEKRGVPVSVRVPQELAKRLEKLIPKMAKTSTFATLGVVTKTAVIKLALLRGVEALEAEFK